VGSTTATPTEFATLGVSCAVLYRRWPSVTRRRDAEVTLLPRLESETKCLLIFWTYVQDAATQHRCCKSREVAVADSISVSSPRCLLRSDHRKAETEIGRAVVFGHAGEAQGGFHFVLRV
jgi:hypothetical protein